MTFWEEPGCIGKRELEIPPRGGGNDSLFF